MTQPAPIFPLQDPCTSIFNNTLYVFTSDGFQSLSLTAGSKWKQLPMGVKVSGAVCVQGTPNNDTEQAAFFVVGGQTNSSMVSYTGLQKYVFSQDAWETCQPLVNVTQNRINHAASFLNATASLLVYAGSQQGDDGLSSQTFVISTEAPFGVAAFSSDAPPAVSPILLPWNDTHAVMLGGDSNNKEIFLFDPENGWTNLGLSLTQGLANTTQVQAAIIDGNDDSKVLEVFNVGVTPNSVQAIALLGSGGASATTGEFLGSPTSSVSSPTSSSAARVRRSLTLSNWPEYNDTLAPTSTRSGFSLAQGQNGLVVIAGGDSQNPLGFFNSDQNAWIDPSELLGTQSSLPSSVSQASATATSTSSTSTSTAAAANQGSSNDTKTVVLASVLGGVVGLVGICCIALFLLRRKRRERERLAAAAQADEDKDFFDLPPPDIPGSSATPHGVSVLSDSSRAIMAGRVGNTLPAQPILPLSPIDVLRVEDNPFAGPAAGGYIPPPRPIPSKNAFADPNNPNNPFRSQLRKHQSSGWNRYFASNEESEMADMSRDTQTTFFTDQSRMSDYNDSGRGVRSQHESATVPPLNVGRQTLGDGQVRDSEIPGSPTLGHAQVPGLAISDGLSLGRPESSIRSVSIDGSESHAIPQTNWDPVEGTEQLHRPASSVYTDSARGTMVDTRDSTVTTFPRLGRGVTITEVEPRGRGGHSDMSWLNLGTTRE